MKREPTEPHGFIKPNGAGIPRLQAGEEVKSRQARTALTTAVAAVGGGVLFGIARLGTVLAGWISTLPHPGVIVGVGGAALLIGLLSLDPRLRK